MIHYILVDNTGRVCRRGIAANKLEIPVVAGLSSIIVDESDKRRPETAIVVDVGHARRMQYPSVGDQLDALWKALGPLIEHPEAEAMLARILAIKEANPKPSN